MRNYSIIYIMLSNVLSKDNDASTKEVADTDRQDW